MNNSQLYSLSDNISDSFTSRPNINISQKELEYQKQVLSKTVKNMNYTKWYHFLYAVQLLEAQIISNIILHKFSHDEIIRFLPHL